MSALAEQVTLVVCFVLAIAAVAVIVVLITTSFEDIVDEHEVEEHGKADLLGIALYVVMLASAGALVVVSR